MKWTEQDLRQYAAHARIREEMAETMAAAFEGEPLFGPRWLKMMTELEQEASEQKRAACGKLTAAEHALQLTKAMIEQLMHPKTVREGDLIIEGIVDAYAQFYRGILKALREGIE